MILKMATKLFVSLLLSFCFVCDGFELTGPFHASCKIDWTFSANCDAVRNRLVSKIQAWKGPENCQGGGERCLYTLVSNTAKEVTAIHETPVKHYKDDLTFTFTQVTDPNDTGCNVHGYSKSETWYAVLDQGTNYCNLHNLITGADLDKDPKYTENTRSSICTQFSSADCDIY